MVTGIIKLVVYTVSTEWNRIFVGQKKSNQQLFIYLKHFYPLGSQSHPFDSMTMGNTTPRDQTVLILKAQLLPENGVAS